MSEHAKVTEEHLKEARAIVNHLWHFECGHPSRVDCIAEFLADRDAARGAGPESRSVQRRKAIQRGEPMPTFHEPPICPKHNEAMKIVFYERRRDDGSPAGNGWSCPSCTKEREKANE